MSGERVLDPQSRETLLQMARKTAGSYQVEACCAYGSKVAGYARSDSDYDLLLVLKNYGHVIRYDYVRDGMNASVLMVDSRSLLSDAEKAALGEFVAGRLLHVYEPLVNGEFIENVETTYKKRVVMEELREIASINALYGELLIPVEYFIFSKVQKRSKVYPHALYSYIKTYSGTNGRQNLEWSRRGFMRALQELEKEGYVTLEGDNIRILPAKLSTRKRSKRAMKTSNAFRGAFSYLVHTYAGRRTLHFLREEARSKINRRKEITTLPPEIENPKSLLKLREGLLVDGSDWLEQLAEGLGFRDYNVERKKIGDVHAATTLYTISGDGKSEMFVVKHYTSARAIKWAAMNCWVAGLTKFQVDPAARLGREYAAIRHIKELGMGASTIIAAAPERRLLVTKYIEGELLSHIIEQVLRGRSNDTRTITEFGRALGELHSKDCTIVDTKPSNIIVSGGRLYFTDLEQFCFGHDTVWDVACFIYYSIKFASNEEGARTFVRAFLDGYLKSGEVATIRKALSKKYVPPFYPALVIGVLTAVRNEIRNRITASA